MIVTSCMILMMLLMFFAWGVALKECRLREEMEEELWRIRHELACRKHPAMRGEVPGWWEDMSL